MPEYSQLSLSNIALNLAGGRSRIASLEENSNEAKNCALIFNKVAVEVLSRVPWNFAVTTAQLEPVDNGSLIPPQWRGAWARPSNALRLISVRDGAVRASHVPIFPGGIGQTCGAGGSVSFAVGNVGSVHCVLTNATLPLLTYVMWVSDFNKWTSDAIELFTTKLASRLAIPISNDKGLYDRLSQEVRVLESRFDAANANEGVDVSDIPTDWMLERDANLIGDGPWLASAGGTTPTPPESITVIVDGGREG